MYRVQELLDRSLLEIGDGYRAKNDELASHGLPFARAGNLNNGFQFEGADRFPSSALHRVGRKRSMPGDVVFTSKGTVGRFAFVHDNVQPFVYSPQLCFWRSLDVDFINSRWLYYWMHSREFQTQFRGVAKETDMADYVSLQNQRRFTITVPPKEEQSRIARSLGTIDDKIELNRRMCATLEEIARTIFRSWFVDFDPVRAKAAAIAEGRDSERAAMAAISGKTDAKLDALPAETFESLARTAALFPDSLMESGIGDTPATWPVRTLSQVFQINPARSLGMGKSAKYLDMASVPTNSARAGNPIDRVFSSGSKFMNGDTLLARITPCLENGKTAFVDFLEDGEIGWGSTEFIVLRSNPPVPEPFAYFLARTDEFRSFAIANMSGTSGRQRVPTECFAQYELAIGPEPIMERFCTLSTGILQQMKSLDRESATLAALRDTLLPKLLSGSLSLAECEGKIGAAAS